MSTNIVEAVACHFLSKALSMHPALVPVKLCSHAAALIRMVLILTPSISRLERLSRMVEAQHLRCIRP